MNDRSQEPDQPEAGRPAMRFEATIHPGAGQQALAQVADLDLDRLPDPKGEMRLLISLEEAAMLAERGYEVRLLKAHPVRPLDASMVMDDETAEGWLEERVRGLRGDGS
jgi:hypothetical protein